MLENQHAYIFIEPCKTILATNIYEVMCVCDKVNISRANIPLDFVDTNFRKKYCHITTTASDAVQQSRS